MCYWSFCACRIVLNIMLYISIHIVSNDRISFFLCLNYIPLYIHHICITHSSINGFTLNLFLYLYFMAIMNNVVINMEVQISLQHTDFISWIIWQFYFSIFKYSPAVCIMMLLIYITFQQHARKGSSSPSSSPAFAVFGLLVDSHSQRGVLCPGFYLHYLEDW